MNRAEHELLVTSAYTEKQLLARFGKPAYSYRVVKGAFNSLLRQWAPATDIEDPAAQLPEAVAKARAAGRLPIHVSFLPLQDLNICEGAVNIGVPAWEFPDIPAEDLGGNPNENWVRQSDKLDLVITHTQFSRDAFLRAGVRTPVHVVPVPVNTAFFDIPAWQPGQKVVIDCPSYVLCPGLETPQTVARPPQVEKAPSLFKRLVVQPLKKSLPDRFVYPVQRLKHGIHAGRVAFNEYPRRIALIESPTLELEGIVYTSVFNPADSRKNWQDMVTAFLYALADRPDATLVFKLTSNKKDAQFWLRHVSDQYFRYRIPHACKVVFVTAHLSDRQMTDLARGSTYYLNASRAEGSCLPLQDFLTAGRPSIAPPNTGMADSLDADSSFLVDSDVEATPWPHDPEMRFRTTWHRINWASLREQIAQSYRLAKEDPAHIVQMGTYAREKMRDLVSPEAVWPTLKRALDEAVGRQGTRRQAA